MSEGRRSGERRETLALHGRNAAVVASLTPQSQAASNPCLNCGTNVQLEFCPECGQHALDPDPTLRECLYEMAEDFLHWDGKVVTTFRTLITKPGELTREYLAGRRVRFISPLRVYLVCSALYFVISAITPRAPIAVGTGLTARISGNSIDLMDVALAIPKMMFVFVPLFAFLLMLAFRQSRRRFPQHLAFALHVHAFLFLTLTLMLVRRATSMATIQVGATVLGIVAVLFYLAQAMRTVYAETLGGAVARTTLVTISYFVAFGLAMVVIFGSVVLLRS